MMQNQKVMSQMKGQDKIPEKQLKEVEIVNLPEKEFRMIVKMIQDLGKRIEAKNENIQEMFTKDLQELKNKQTEINNTLLLLLSCFSRVRPIDGSPPGFPIPGILHARTLEWAAISFSNSLTNSSR